MDAHTEPEEFDGANSGAFAIFLPFATNSFYFLAVPGPQFGTKEQASLCHAASAC